MNEFIDNLNISSIKISGIFPEDTMFIDFIIENKKAFYLTFFKEDYFWIPGDIRHEHNKNTHLKNQPCPFCKKNIEGEICNYFGDYETYLLKRILNDSSIRIKLITEGIIIKYENEK